MGVGLARQRNGLTNSLVALLPEMFELKVYLDHGCSNIVEYAGKFLGLSGGVVKKRLNLEKHLVDKPKLRALIPIEGVHKVAIVATIATPETDGDWADKVENMSKNATQKLAKEWRQKGKGRCEAATERVKIELDAEMQQMFFKLKEKLAKDCNNKEAMKRILRQLAEEEWTGKKAENSGGISSPRGEVTRYVPVATKQKLEERSGGICEYPGCNHAAQCIHHGATWFETKSHKHLVHLCKSHHEFMHNGLVENQEKPPADWKLGLGSELREVDRLYRERWRG